MRSYVQKRTIISSLSLVFQHKNTKKTETNDSFIKVHLYRRGLEALNIEERYILYALTSLIRSFLIFLAFVSLRKAKN